METQIVRDKQQNQQKQIVFPSLQHGTDALHYATYDISAGSILHYIAHCHPEYEIFLLLDGHLDFIVDGRLFHLNSGEALFLDGTVVHGHADCNAHYGRYLVFSFGEDFLFPDPNSHIYRKFFMPIQSGQYTFTKHITGEKNYEKEILNILKELPALNKNIPENALSIQICLLRIFNIMNRENAFDPSPDSSLQKDIIKSALWYINQNYASSLSIHDISRFLNVSPDHFTRLFKATMGSTPKEYILNLRIHHAISEMYAKPSCKLAEVAFNAGFSEPNYFSRAFKKKMGISPSEYQQQIFKNRDAQGLGDFD